MKSGVEKLDVANPDIQRFVIAECKQSRVPKKDHDDNYSADNLRRQFNSNRFDEGFFVVREEEQPIAFFGLTKHYNWLVITRLIHLKDDRQNFIWGAGGRYIFPFLDETYSSKYAGVFGCMNGSKATMMSIMIRRLQSTPQTSPRHPLDSYKMLPYTVLYRGVEQAVLYKSFIGADKVPPLERYKDIEWNSHRVRA
jgi:hypothetical protein